MRRIEPTGATEADELGFGPRTWDQPQFLARGQLTTVERMPTVVLERSGPQLDLGRGPDLDVDRLTIDDPLTGRPMSGTQFLDRRLAIDGLLVYADGGVRYETYRNGMNVADHHVVHSVTKTLTTMAIGIAVGRGWLATDAEVRDLVPAVAGLEAWTGITVQHVLDMATGLATEEHYEDPDSMYWRYADAVGYFGPEGGAIGALGFVADELTRRSGPPGAVFDYASYLTNLLPACLASATGRPAVELYEELLVARIGAEADALLNTDTHGHPIVEGQLNLTLRDLARWGLLYLNDGHNLAGEAVVPAAWVAETFRPSAGRANAFAASDYADLFPGAQYHNQMWLLDPEGGVGAMLGIHGQFVWLDRRRQVLIAGVASYPTQVDPLLVVCLQRLWSAVSGAAVH